MATQKIQSFAPYDSSTVANYKAWAQTVGSAMSTLGWVLAGDAGQVNWSNVVAPATLPTISLVQTWRGAWVGGTSYAVGDIVTSSGLTYQCLSATQVTLTAAVQNTAQALTLSSVAASSGGVAVYTGTITAGGSNAFLGFIFVITGFGSSNNNGTFICTASTTTTLTLSTTSATIESHAATATSSATNIGYVGTIAFAGSNAFVGHSFVTSGFTNGANNTTFTVTASSTTCFGGVVSGVNETHAALATENTAPASDVTTTTAINFHWGSYNYEVWVSTGPLSATLPIYIKFIYTSMSTSTSSNALVISVGTNQTNGIVGGNAFNAGGLVVTNGGSLSNQGSTQYECDFCGTADKVAFIMWRGLSGGALVFCIDRAHDQNGADLDSYVNVLCSGASNSQRYQTIYKPGTGTVSPAATNSVWPCINDSNATSASNGQVPAYLCFPMIGYMANPCLGVIAMHSGDCLEGGLINVVMYGTSHTFLMTKASAASVLTANGAAGIQWEIF